jgi:hypothetical protein
VATKGFDIRSFQKYLTPQATDDFNKFLEKIPQNAGHGVLIAAGIAWGMVAALGLFTMMQAKDLTELRASLQGEEALKPVVPVITMSAVPAEDLKRMVEGLKGIYSGLTINASGGKITVQSKDTASYAEFREALGHVVNGGASWKIGVEGFCVGRECKPNSLDASLKVEKLRVDKPSS